jgi:hypothetical protein
MANNAQIAAAHVAASHYDRIAALEHRVAALEAQLRRVRPDVCGKRTIIDGAQRAYHAGTARCVSDREMTSWPD